MSYVTLPIYQVKSPELRMLLMNFAAEVNSIDATNIQDESINLRKLNWLEFPFLIVAASSGSAISTTGSLQCGGYFNYDPNKFPATTGGWYFEAMLQISSSSYQATARLMNGSTQVGSVSTTSTSWNVVRSGQLTMPAIPAVLTVTLASNNASGTAFLSAAKLIYVP